jgi:hypothetical protein
MDSPGRLMISGGQLIAMSLAGGTVWSFSCRARAATPPE